MENKSSFQHKIVLIPFPFDDLSGVKVRPAVCLTDAVGEHGHVVVAFITSRVIGGLLDSDLLLRDDHPGFQTTGLKVSSTVRLHRLITVGTSLIRRELGALPLAFQTIAAEKLKKLFSRKNLP